jgi:flavin-dependent dehydrogenase
MIFTILVVVLIGLIIHYILKYPKKKIEKIDVLIIGGGPSGSSTALTLNAINIKHIILEKKSEDDPIAKIGDCLHANAKPILASLDLLETLESQNYVRCNGNVSAWGSETLSYNDSIFSPYGAGWHLDRVLFDKTLRDTATKNGSVVYYDHIFNSIQKNHKNKWIVKVTNMDKEKFFECDWIVDASGRFSKVATTLGQKRLNFDDLLAYIVIFKTDDVDISTFSLVESIEDGWFYSAPLSKKERVVMFHTDDKIPTAKEVRNLNGFLEKLNGSFNVNEIIKKYNYVPKVDRPSCVSAKSQKLDKFGCWKDNWIAVGDSALSYDPLSSQGIMYGLMGGVAAANTIARILSSNNDEEKINHMDYYANGCESIFKNYMILKKKFYNMEQRYPQSQFWNKYKNL